jgi:predicted Zn-dependent protease
MSFRPYLKYPLALIACLALSACSSKADRIEAGLARGGDYVRDSNWDKASIEVRNVLQIDPKNVRAYLIAGQIDDGRSAIRGAYANYSKALELKPDLVEAKVGLARVYLLAGDLPSAENMVNQTLKAEPGNLRAQALQVALAARQGRTSQALADAGRLVESNQALPVDSSLLLAGLFFNVKDPGKALQVLDKALTVDGKSLPLLQMAAEVASNSGSDAAVEARADGYYSAATQIAPKNNELWKGWALSHIRRNEIDKAEAVLRDSLRAVPDDGARSVALLEFMTAFRGAEAAEKEFTAAIAARPKDTVTRFALADFYDSQKRPQDSTKVLEEIVALGKDAPAGLTARGRLAAIWVADGQVDKARTTLSEILKLNPRDGNALVLRGRILLAVDGNARDAIIDLRAAAKDQPGSAEIVNLLTQAHRAAGEPQLAREAIADAVKFQPQDAQLHLLLAAEMAAAKDYKAAELEVDEAVKLRPQYLRAYEMKVELALAQNDTAGAERAALALQTQFPKSPVGFVRLGRVYARQQKFEAALKLYDAAARVAPKAGEPVVAGISLLIGQRRYAEAKSRIDALVDASPKLALGHELRGELALVQRDLPLAEQSFTNVLNVKPAPPSAYKNLASVMVARNNVSGALAVLDEGEKANPNDVTLPLARAEWLAGAGRTDEGIAVYEALLKRAPRSESTANNLAYVLAEAKGDKASLERALQVASRFDNSPTPGYVDTLGWVRYRLGQYDQAATVLERAVALAPNEPLLQLHFGMALVRKGDVARGKEFLRKAIESKAALPGMTEARSLVAQG